MIKYNNKVVDINHFPDGTLLIKEKAKSSKASISWYFENNEEMVALYYLVKHLKNKGVDEIRLILPYIPNARQDRVKEEKDVFTLKYFAEFINSLNFKEVEVLDPHSHVSEALIDRIVIKTPQKYVDKALKSIGKDVILFFPDEGAMKRYSSMFDLPYVFGIKKRDWKTGEIQGLDVSGQTDLLKGKDVLIIDDICSRGGTFYKSAQELKKLGVKDIYLYVSHLENTIFKGELIETDLVKRIYTTNSIFTLEDKKVEVFEYE